ncbi:MAG TPA: mobilization protein [Niastella sp.]
MEQNENIRKKKGGRPKKAIKKDQLLPVKCDKEERKKIETRAKSVNLSVSQYMREISLNGHIDRREIVFPKEVLQLAGTLNHLAANLNQIAKKRNGIEELNALERATLQIQSRDLKRLAEDIKNYLK